METVKGRFHTHYVINSTKKYDDEADLVSFTWNNTIPENKRKEKILIRLLQKDELNLRGHTTPEKYIMVDIEEVVANLREELL